MSNGEFWKNGDGGDVVNDFIPKGKN